MFGAVFSPLSKSSCIYFFALTVFFFVVLVLTLFGEIYFAATNYKKLDMKIIAHGVLLLINIFLAYFINRLFYSMCTKSLH